MLDPRGLARTRQCEVCRRWAAAGICAGCSAAYGGAVPRCPRCALRLPQPGSPCGPCAREAPPQASTVCATDYAFPWDRLIAAFKFDGQVELATTLAGRLVGALRQRAATGPDLVLPVPISAERLATRGHHQAWELARRVARALGLPARHDLLLRLLPTREQVELDRAERLRNLRAAFAVARGAPEALRGRAIALVDDVMTTGATAAECTRTLLAAGAARVEVWVVARTPA